MSDQPLISVHNLYKRYERKTVLKGVSLQVQAGQVVALLGANGAGKTTLMRTICGLTRPDRGEITLGGVALSKAGAELRRYIGLVGHLPLLYDNLSGYENLAFFARMYDMQQPTARIEAVLQSVNLWAQRRDPVRTYSRGMTQRLAIARAIVHDPPVLLLDEPDTGLDQTSSQMLHGLITQLGASNRAILLTTHNLDRALEWADSICILVNGQIVQEAPSASLTGTSLRQLYAEATVG
ncbi:MAG: heme ABC exporter ATP-binding protein CcmA [Sphingopyxis sp.]|nr:heme ABC exporter ATP-binding protein CcmA [Sphingopyxis sp.]